MSVGILLITHPGVGSSLLHTATRILGDTPLTVRCLEVPPGRDAEPATLQAGALAAELDDGDGVLVLTDIYGATPSNVACNLMSTGGVSVLSGLNLPMLIRTLNYPADDLAALTAKAREGGERGIHQHSIPTHREAE